MPCPVHNQITNVNQWKGNHVSLHLFGDVLDTIVYIVLRLLQILFKQSGSNKFEYSRIIIQKVNFLQDQRSEVRKISDQKDRIETHLLNSTVFIQLYIELFNESYDLLFVLF